jgi:hypothetical protein
MRLSAINGLGWSEGPQPRIVDKQQVFGFFRFAVIRPQFRLTRDQTPDSRIALIAKERCGV